jgi:hypothetical protein
MADAVQPTLDPGLPESPVAPADISEPRASVHVTIDGDYDFSERDIWPDGDAPENWTAEDAKNVIDDYRSDFFNLGELDVSIYVHDAPEGKKHA